MSEFYEKQLPDEERSPQFDGKQKKENKNENPSINGHYTGSNGIPQINDKEAEDFFKTIEELSPEEYLEYQSFEQSRAKRFGIEIPIVPFNCNEEQALIESWLRQKNESAFTKLLKMHLNAGYRTALFYTKNTEDANDCMQDALVKIWNASKYDIKNFKSFFITIVRNTCLNFLKSKVVKMRKNLLNLDNALEMCDMDDSGNKYFNESNNDQWEKLKLDNKLSDLQYNCLYCKYKLEMSYDEIADRFGVKLTSVNNAIFKAKEKIRENHDGNDQYLFEWDDG